MRILRNAQVPNDVTDQRNENEVMINITPEDVTEFLFDENFDITASRLIITVHRELLQIPKNCRSDFKTYT